MDRRVNLPEATREPLLPLSQTVMRDIVHAKERAKVLARISFLSQCPLAELENLPGEPFSFKEAELVYARGQPADYVYFLLFGRIRSYQLWGERELTTTFLDAANTFGEMEVLSEHSGGVRLGYAAHVKAVTNCMGWRVSADSFVSLLRSHQGVAYSLLGDLCQRSCNAATREMSAFVDVSVRVASLLLEVVEGSPRRVCAGAPHKLRMTARNIGHHLGVTERSVTRTFAGFKKRGWIRHSKGWLVVDDLESLRAFCGGFRFRLVHSRK